MTEDAKEEVKYVLSLLKITCIKNKLSIATNPDGHLVFFSTEEYIANGNKVQGCDGIVIDIKDLVQ